MTIKIFFGNKPVFLCDKISPALTELIHHSETIYIDEISSPAINSLVHEMANPTIKTGLLYSNNIEQIKRNFFKHFELIRAAGGLIKNEKNEVLFIFRRGKWDLPKGKNDENENPKDCALREVKEETGLLGVKVGRHICITYHVYKEFGKHIIKETDWFEMNASSLEKLIPQRDEGIERIEWVSQSDISNKLKNSYALITDVLNSSRIEINN